MTDYKTLYVILTANASAYDGVLARSGAKTDRFAGQLDNASDSSQRFSTELNSMSGRVRLIIDSLALAGPSLVKFGAVAIPAITGLSAQLGFAAAGAGAVMTAVAGMGDVMKAVNDYQLEPTAANLAKVRQEMSTLSVTSREFAMDLDESMDSLLTVRDAAREGFFPGAGEGLDDLLTRLPLLRRTMYELADTAGDMAAETGEALSSDRAAEFIGFIRRNARPALADLTGTVGHLAAGMGELWMAFDPVNDEFSDWLLKQAESFDKWAQQVGETEDFEEFMDFIRESGPEVAATLTAVADAGVQIVKALAPIAGPSLKGLELVAEAIATIAASPLGTPLLAAFSAATLLNRTLMVTAGLMTKIGVTGAGGGAVKATSAGVSSAFFGALSSGSEKARTNVRGLTGDLKTMATVSRTAGARSARDQARYNEALQRTRATAAGVTKAAVTGGAAVGAMAALSTGAADKAGLANTATLGLVGTLAGPYGAALGAAVGFTADIAGSNNEWEESIRGVNAGLGETASSLDQWLGKVKEASSLASDQQSFEQQNVWKSLFTDPSRTASTAIGGFEALFGGQTNSDEMEAEAKKAEETSDRVLTAFGNVAVGLGKEGVFENAAGTMSMMVPDLEKVAGVIQRAEPYLARMGLTLDDVAKMDTGELQSFQTELVGLIQKGDSVKGRMEGVGAAVRALQDDTLSTADSATALSQALETLLGPALNAEAATDAWRESLRQLRTELKASAGFEGGTVGGRENRALTRQYAADSIERLTALAGVSTTTEKQIADAVAATREEFVKSGIAAGFSREEIEKRAKALGLTPRLVKTVFEAAGITKADLAARELRGAYKDLPRKVQTEVRENGVPDTIAKVNRLVEKYGLTEKQRTALVTLKDLASKNIIDVQALLNQVARTNAQARVDAETAAARAKIQSIIDSLNKLAGKTVTTYVDTVNRSFNAKRAGVHAQYQEANGGIWAGGVKAYADGGFSGDGGYYPREPMMVRGGANILWGEPETGWEAYISGKPGMEARNVKILAAAAGRFGYGLTARGREPSGGRGVTVVQQQFPSRLKLVVGGREFDAHVAGVAGVVAKETVDSAAATRDGAGRRNWS